MLYKLGSFSGFDEQYQSTSFKQILLIALIPGVSLIYLIAEFSYLKNFLLVYTFFYFKVYNEASVSFPSQSDFRFILDL